MLISAPGKSTVESTIVMGVNQGTYDPVRLVRDVPEAKKVDILVIRDILGHSQLSVTADLYTHVLTPEVIEAIEKMDAILSHDRGDS